MNRQTIKIALLWSVFLLMDALIAFGVSEAWVRNFIPVKNIGYFVDNKIGVRYCPKQRAYGHVEEGYSNITITNSLGCHDVDRAMAKDNGISRIHFYGDSMIAGMGVQIDQTIPTLVERHLNSYDLPFKFEVLNMAAGTESTCAQILTYQQIGTIFDADLAICYFMGDFTDNVFKLSGNKHAPYFKIDQNNKLVYLPPIPKDTTTLLSKFKRRWCMLYRLLANKFIESKFYYNSIRLKKEISFYLGKYLGANPTEKTQTYDETRKEIYINEAWPLTLRLIQYFNDEVHKNGVRFILADGRPFNEPINNVYTNQDLEAFCKLNRILYIPAHTIYSELKSSSKVTEYFLSDGHPNQWGNNEISKFLAEKIKTILIDHGIIANKQSLAF